jgi:hypothetical protein
LRCGAPDRPDIRERLTAQVDRRVLGPSAMIVADAPPTIVNGVIAHRSEELP